jgi:hypothetical protein
MAKEKFDSEYEMHGFSFRLYSEDGVVEVFDYEEGVRLATYCARDLKDLIKWISKSYDKIMRNCFRAKRRGRVKFRERINCSTNRPLIIDKDVLNDKVSINLKFRIPIGPNEIADSASKIDFINSRCSLCKRKKTLTISTMCNRCNRIIRDVIVFRMSERKSLTDVTVGVLKKSGIVQNYILSNTPIYIARGKLIIDGKSISKEYLESIGGVCNINKRANNLIGRFL